MNTDVISITHITKHPLFTRLQVIFVFPNNQLLPVLPNNIIMSKKNFMSGLDALLENPQVEKKKLSTPKSTSVDKDMRATFIVSQTLLQKVKHIAYWERLKIKDVVEHSFEKHIKHYEAKYGTITLSKK